MSAAEYYGYDHDGRSNGNHRTNGDDSDLENRAPAPPLKDTKFSTPTTYGGPYQSASDDFSYQSSGSQLQFQQDNMDHPYRPHVPDRDSTASVATQSKLYADPYADNIPLRTRPPGGVNSSTSIIPDPGLPPPSKSKKGFFSAGKKRPWFCYIMAVIQVGVFIAELVRNAALTGSPIATKPSFNPMIGPSAYVQINMGGRYVLCMQYMPDLWKDSTGTEINLMFPCPNSTTTDSACTLAEHCGFNGRNVPTQEQMMNGESDKGPNQWWRFITPIFLHAGIVHIAFNMLLQLRLGGDMEKDIGPIRFAFVYFSSGIFGFVLGGNYAPRGIVSTGASGCLFGVLALVLLDLFYTWGTPERPKPWKDLGFLMIDIVISFILGLLPGLDNFAHIGGFLMGLMLGLTVLRSPTKLRKRIGEGEPPYTPMATAASYDGKRGVRGFLKDPVAFFKGRKGMWWAWWLVRAGTLAAAIVAASVLINNFYVGKVECGWCKYLSCLVSVLFILVLDC